MPKIHPGKLRTFDELSRQQVSPDRRHELPHHFLFDRVGLNRPCVNGIEKIVSLPYHFVRTIEPALIELIEKVGFQAVRILHGSDGDFSYSLNESLSGALSLRVRSKGVGRFSNVSFSL